MPRLQVLEPLIVNDVQHLRGAVLSDADAKAVRENPDILARCIEIPDEEAPQKTVATAAVSVSAQPAHED